ncbi:MAG TPA: hypothetical protein VK103_01285, partial [Bacillota bacterium]|nr:hypothetical protein [Bacillota bacterium]
TGPELEAWLPVTGGEVTLAADAGQPYVIHPQEVAVADPEWGEGTGLQNPFFTPGDLRGWQTSGASSVVLSDRGHHEVHLGEDGAAAHIRQPITGLEPGGRYAASVLVQIGAEPGETRRTTLTVDTPDGSSTTHLDRSTLKNTQNSDPKKGTRFQRIWTYFTAPDDGTDPELRIETVAGDAPVLLDHVRVAAGSRPDAPEGAIVAEDFENVPFGYGVFVSCNIRSHLSEPHAPYTNIGWNGKELDDVLDGGYSLKTRATGATLQYRSLPSTIEFRPGHRYRVEFDYQSRTEADWVTGVDEPESRDIQADRLPKTTGTERWRYEFTAPDEGDTWIGMRSRIGDSTEVVIDNLVVYELD